MSSLDGDPRTVYPGQSLRLAGRGSCTAIRLKLEQGANSRTVRLEPDRVILSELAESLYGRIAVTQLERLGGAAKDVATAYATHFRVVGRTCSLVMLESEADYARFDIRPAENAAVVRRTPVGPVLAETAQRKRSRSTFPAKPFL